MIDDMGVFRTSVAIALLSDHELRHTFENVMVDTGSEYSWFPEEELAALGITPVRTERFESADGRILERNIGFAVLYAGGSSSPTIVVFGLPGDLSLLGAFGLEGLNVRVDLVRRELVPAGPVPVAAAA